MRSQFIQDFSDTIIIILFYLSRTKQPRQLFKEKFVTLPFFAQRSSSFASFCITLIVCLFDISISIYNILGTDIFLPTCVGQFVCPLHMYVLNACALYYLYRDMRCSRPSGAQILLLQVTFDFHVVLTIRFFLKFVLSQSANFCDIKNKAKLLFKSVQLAQYTTVFVTQRLECTAMKQTTINSSS